MNNFVDKGVFRGNRAARPVPGAFRRGFWPGSGVGPACGGRLVIVLYRQILGLKPISRYTRMKGERNVRKVVVAGGSAALVTSLVGRRPGAGRPDRLLPADRVPCLPRGHRAHVQPGAVRRAVRALARPVHRHLVTKHPAYLTHAKNE